MAKTEVVFNVTVDISGIERIVAETPDKVSAFLDAEAEQMVNGVKQSFGTGPAGRTYKRGKEKHTASAEPGPPAVDTGELIGSIIWKSVAKFVRRIMDGVEYGIHQEVGTEKMGPRPFMGPEFERTRQRIGQDAKDFGLGQ